MNVESITVPWAPVKALLNLAGKEDIRKWLNGVWIDRQGPYLVVWASTGIVLGAYQTTEPSTEGPDILLPRNVIEAAKGIGPAAIVIRDGENMRIDSLGASQSWKDENYKKIDWRRVLPDGRADNVARQFDIALAHPFDKVRKALGGDAVRIAHSTEPKQGTDGLLVSFYGNPAFVGVVMPIRSEHATVVDMMIAAPDWVRERFGETAEAAGDDLC